jgi:hypothetical protein
MRVSVIGVVMVVGCGQLGGASEEDTAAPVLMAVPLDTSDSLAAVVERSRYAFDDHDGVVIGGDANAGTEVSLRGVAITPFHWERPGSARGDKHTRGSSLHLNTVEIGCGRRDDMRRREV